MSAENAAVNTIGQVEEVSELDKFLGPRYEQVVLQERFHILPTFQAKTLIEGTLPILSRWQEIIRKKPELRGVRTNISQIEIIYPWLLHRTGLISEPLPEYGVKEGVNEASLTGILLHEVDGIYNAISRGITGDRVRMFFPTYKDEQILPIKEATSGLRLENGMKREDIEEVLIEAWKRYREKVIPIQVKELTLPGFGVAGPKEEEEFIEGPVVNQKAISLAAAWAREIAKEAKRPLTWEFANRGITQREVLVALNLIGQKIQFIGKLDSVSRRIDHRKVSSQFIDLKTGKSEFKSRMDQEIHKRQAQTMEVMAERFTAEYLLDYESLQPRREAFFVRTYHDSTAYRGRVNLVAFRYVDKQMGKMWLERARMTDWDRKDFNLWFSWYGSMRHIYRDEIDDLIKKNKHYMLAEIEVPDDWGFEYSVGRIHW
jgi:hypothetical protein